MLKSKLTLVPILAAAIGIVAIAWGSDETAMPTQPTGASDPTSTAPVATLPAVDPTATSEAGSQSDPTPTSEPAISNRAIAPDFTLPNANGEQVTLSELSAEQPVVVVFYRAFW